MICSKEDYYTYKPEDHSFVKLIFSDGKHAFVQNSADWAECKKYQEESRVGITAMSIRMRSNYDDIPVEDFHGVFFKTGAVAQIGADIDTFNTFLVGVKMNDAIAIRKYRLPELMVYEEEIRQATKEELEFVIPSKTGL